MLTENGKALRCQTRWTGLPPDAPAIRANSCEAQMAEPLIRWLQRIEKVRPHPLLRWRLEQKNAVFAPRGCDRGRGNRLSIRGG